jgi:hypothetical protein
MQYMSIVFLFKSIKAYTNTKVALTASLAWGLYYLGYQEIPSILTEPFTSFLMSSLLLTITSYYTKGNKNYLYINEINSNREFCSMPSKQTFRCNVFRDGTLVSSSIN